jgi:hypothetical protein
VDRVDALLAEDLVDQVLAADIGLEHAGDAGDRPAGGQTELDDAGFLQLR